MLAFEHVREWRIPQKRQLCGGSRAHARDQRVCDVLGGRRRRLRNFEYWNNHAGRLLLEYGQAGDAPRAARVYALLNVALYDAGVACWDAKYAYWTIRPFQLDPAFETVVKTPNHPSYPAAHACYSMTAALVLAHLFPRDAETLGRLGHDSGESRIWAGIHYPSDVKAGRGIAQQVAARAIERASRRRRPLRASPSNAVRRRRELRSGEEFAAAASRLPTPDVS